MKQVFYYYIPEIFIFRFNVGNHQLTNLPQSSFNPFAFRLHSGDSYMSSLAKCEDTDEIPHHVAFHQGLHVLQQKKTQSLIEEIHCIWKLKHSTS